MGDHKNIQSNSPPSSVDPMETLHQHLPWILHSSSTLFTGILIWNCSLLIPTPTWPATLWIQGSSTPLLTNRQCFCRHIQELAVETEPGKGPKIGCFDLGNVLPKSTLFCFGLSEKFVQGPELPATQIFSSAGTREIWLVSSAHHVEIVCTSGCGS